MVCHDRREENANGSDVTQDGHMWQPPDELDEYRLVEFIGGGVAGQVYLAHDRLLDRPVAIKFNTESIEAFQRERVLQEARAIARIQHPNVMVIHRVGEFDGRPFLVSEFLHGKRLGELALPLDWRRLREVATELARGLAAVHRHGIVHRDLSHKNIMLCADTNTVKILDFGLAEIVRDRRVEVDVGTSGPQESPVPTSAHDVAGTPHYVAPELWQGAPANFETDIYAVGVLLYILATGKTPYQARTPEELIRLQEAGAPAAVHSTIARFDTRFAGIIGRCLEFSPASRFHSGDELREALESLVVMSETPQPSAGNPYRGLRPFDSNHSNLFFGRGAEIREVIDRLRGESFVAVAGDSGVGKSSLCRAGVAPLVEAGTIDSARTWRTCTMIPGSTPLQALLAAFVTPLGLAEQRVRAVVTSEPEKLRWMIHEALGPTEGRLLFIDQFEELVTISAADEREIVGKILGLLTVGLPGVRVLCSVRGDFLTRVAQVPSIGDKLSRAIYLLRPLSPQGLRSAIVGPAEAYGVHYESEELINTLVAEGREGSLPILQFALAELWKARPKDASTITEGELERIGGVTGALARHADGMLASLSSKRRREVRKLLIRLVTIDDTRASLAAGEIGDDEDRRAALGSLVEQRLVVVRDVETGSVYEIAHEALINGWGTLRHWLDEEQDLRALRHRLRLSADEWKRLQFPRSTLWGAEQVQESATLEHAALRRVERDFLAASRRAVRQRRWALRAIILGIPLLLGATYIGVRIQNYYDLSERVAQRVQVAHQMYTQGKSSLEQFEQARADAFTAFEKRDADSGEQSWSRSLEASTAADTGFMKAAGEFEAALALDPTRTDVRGWLADVLYERALLAQALHRDKQVAELLTRLELYDVGGQRSAAWNAPGVLALTVQPEGAVVMLEQYQKNEAQRLVLTPVRALETSTEISLAQGSYRLTLTLPDRPPVYAPFQIERNATVGLDITVPPADAIPHGYVYIPAGSFLFGSSDDIVRHLLTSAPPLHTRSTGAFLIARHETTFAEWIEFLEAMPEAEREPFVPNIASLGLGLKLTQVDGKWQLDLTRGEEHFIAAQGENLIYPTRTTRKEQDWMQMPVAGVSSVEALRFLEWLDQSGKLPGARLCREIEWERAARGADARTYPHGYDVSGDEANIDISHDRVVSQVGPDAVGSYPQSASPFGVEELVGNVGEWTRSSLDGEFALRSGAFFFQKIVGQSVNRTVIDASFRDAQVGFRVCASVSGRPPVTDNPEPQGS